jgi:hypothetical protein
LVCESWGQQCEYAVTHDRLVMRRDSHVSYVHLPAKATARPTSNPVAMPAEAAIAAWRTRTTCGGLESANPVVGRSMTVIFLLFSFF